MKRKILGVVLSLTMLCSLAACGKDEVQKESTSSGFVSSETAKTTESKEDIKEEPVTLTMGIFDRGFYGAFIDVNAGETVIDNDYINLLKEMVLEDLNINLEYVAIPRSEEITKIQTLMAAKNEPDIFFTYTASQAATWASEGLVADLTEYIEDTEAGQILKDALGEEILEYGKFSGKQYAINGKSYPGPMLCSYIRKDLVDAVGGEFLEVNGHRALTPSMLKEVLLKIKEAGYCEYPFGLLNAWPSLSPITGSFVDADEFDDLEKRIQNNDYTYFLLDGTKEAYRFFNECYNAELIHPDFPLFADSNMSEMISSGECAFWSYAQWNFIREDSAYAALNEVKPEAEIVAVEIVQEDLSPAKYYKYSGAAAYGMVSSNCENVEAAVKLIAYLCSDEDVHLLTSHGIEGKDFEVDAEGDYTAIEGAEYVANQDMNMFLNNCSCTDSLEKTLRLYRKARPNVDEKFLSVYEEGAYIAVSEGKVAEVPLTGLVPSMADYATSLAENQDNLIIGSITTSSDTFDEVYDRYFEVYMKEGGSQIAKERLDTLSQ